MVGMTIASGPIEQLLEAAAAGHVFLTPADRKGRWRQAFGSAAERVPEPYGLFTDDEQKQVALGFPLRAGAIWSDMRRDLGRLVEAELEYRRALATLSESSKATLVELRRAFTGHVAGMLENAFIHDHGQRLPEILWLALSAEVAGMLSAAVAAAAVDMTTTSLQAIDEIRYTIASRITEAANRGEAEALARIRRVEGAEPSPPTRGFSQQLREDLLPFAAEDLGHDGKELSAYLHGGLRLDATRFQQVVRTTTERLQALRDRDPHLTRALALVDPDSVDEPTTAWIYRKTVLDLLAIWPHPAAPRFSDELRSLLSDLGARLRRFEVAAELRRHFVWVEERGARTVATIGKRAIVLSGFTRPFDFGTPGVLTSMIRRYGLLYDLVEFTQLIEELRRHGHSTEEHALRMMMHFNARIDEIRQRYRLKFEKFLGDGAFYSARSARAILLAGTELRTLYEYLREHGFPFDRGLRLAINVGSYHLLPMVPSNASRPHFEFFGHGLTELARLTTGKRTHEAEDIADFLVSCGYDVNAVISFLAPVRETARTPEHARNRSYSAYVAENGELVNRGGIVTEAFIQDLDGEWDGRGRATAAAWGVRWLILPCGTPEDPGPYVGLRPLGTARLKGLDPVPLAEMVVFPTPLDGQVSLAADEPLLVALQRHGGSTENAFPTPAPLDSEPNLCVVSTLDAGGARTWLIGQFNDESDAVDNAVKVRLTPVGLKDGEPFEAWLFQRRTDLAKLYHGLRRDTAGVTVRLEDWRGNEGYFTCLLAAPHRSPR